MSPLTYAWNSDSSAPADHRGFALEAPEVVAVTSDMVDELCRFASAAAPGWYREPVDVLEAARVAAYQALAPAVREWACWDSLIGAKENHVRLVATAGCGRRLVAEGARLGIKVDLADEPKSSPWHAFSGGASAAYRGLRRGARGALDALDSLGATAHPVPRADLRARRVLLVEYHANNVHCLLPVWKALAARPGYQSLFVAGRAPVRRVLAENGVQAADVRRLSPPIAPWRVSPPEWRELSERFCEMALRSRRTPPTTSVRRGVLKLAPLLQTAKLRALRLQNVFQRFAPDWVLTSTGAAIDCRVAELLAQKCGAISVHLQHGLYESHPLGVHLLAGVVCVWGSLHQEMVMAYPPRGSVVVTGSPKHDELAAALAHVEQVSPPLIVFYCPRAEGRALSASGFSSHLVAFAEAARACPEFRFVAKLHPGEDLGKVRALTASLSPPPNFTMTKGGDAYRMLREAAVAVTFSSTVGYEALLLRRRLVILNLTGRPDWLPLADLGLALRVTRSEDLPAVLRDEVARRDTAPAPPSSVWLADGKACERVLGCLGIASPRPRETSLPSGW